MAIQKTTAINPSLENIEKALTEHGDPHHAFKAVQIAGTNGKGSVCTFLELLYLTCLPEVKIGKYLSPHLISERERILINGEMISPSSWKNLKQLVISKPSEESQELTYFENLTLAAFKHFKNQNIDLAILETGLGGRWDATNTLPTENRLATAITNISWDHMDYLGDTLEKIRFEKEGIKRDGVPHFEGEKYACTANPNAIDGQNFLLALEIFETINKLKISQEIKEEIIAKFNQQYQGRLQYFPEKKLLLDGAHNPAAAKLLNQFIKKQAWANEPKEWHLAFLDKDYKSICENLFEDLDLSQDSFIYHQLDNPRALGFKCFLGYMSSRWSKATEKSQDAKPRFLTCTGNDRTKIVTGSLYLIGKWIDENSLNSLDLEQLA